jgi:hypothetical protein
MQAFSEYDELHQNIVLTFDFNTKAADLIKARMLQDPDFAESLRQFQKFFGTPLTKHFQRGYRTSIIESIRMLDRPESQKAYDRLCAAEHENCEKIKIELGWAKFESPSLVGFLSRQERIASIEKKLERAQGRLSMLNDLFEYLKQPDWVALTRRWSSRDRKRVSYRVFAICKES